MSFSIVIPFYNSSDFILNAIDSIVSQKYNGVYEIILVDDCSTDDSYSLVYQYCKNYNFITLLKTCHNSGPGVARNIALKYAKNDWIVFVDSDDNITSDSLTILNKYIANNIDCILYSDNGNNIKRNDLDSLYKDKYTLLNDYLQLKMDGSAILGIYRREFLIKNNILFTKGLHEDIYFMFLVYYYSTSIKIISDKVYIKNNRKNSIVNSISKNHIHGFFTAFNNIFNIIKENESYIKSYKIGLIAVVAIKLRDIYNYTTDSEERYTLYDYLYYNIKDMQFDINLLPIETKYLKIYNLFLEYMNSDLPDKYYAIDVALKDIMGKSWSCYDLHNSLFLASDEARACCKRFFVNGKQKGDVILCKIQDNETDICNNLLYAKKKLFRRINSGEAMECYGCPHLEFKNWGNIEEFRIEKISFEYHSVCNMRCIYCSPKYYGGKKPIYDVKLLVDSLIASKLLQQCKSIVWGGGEPTIDKEFDYAIINIALNINFRQMVITNSLHYSTAVQLLLDADKINITTSIDSGYRHNFKNIRGVDGFDKVFYHLKLYSSINAKNVTIKYIMMENNSSKEEIENFVSMVVTYQLLGCNFHISCDFNSVSVDNDIVLSACILFSLLKRNFVQVVFFDELLRERISLMSVHNFYHIRHNLMILNLDKYIENYEDYDSVCIWGSNTQTKLLLEKSLFLKNISNIFIVDLDNIGKNILGFVVQHPMEFLNSDIPILISAVQGTPRIYYEFIKMGFDKDRLIDGIVL